MAISRPSLVLFVVGLVVGAGLGVETALSPGSAPRGRPDIILVVVDTLRADRLGCYGDWGALTPFLDRMAAKGLRFDRAYAASSWTIPSVASIFTSRYPSQHRVVDFDARIPESEVTIAERLWLAGYRTAGFTANWRLVRENGYAQGFDWWDSPLPDGVVVPKISAETLRRSVTTWLDSGPSPHPPTFLYVQLMEPHAPLEPPADLREHFAPGLTDEELATLNAKAIDLDQAVNHTMTQAEASQLSRVYGGAVADADRELEALFAELEKRGYLSNAIVIVTADHGEEFFEHGTLGHGFNLFEETVRVPLILGGPLVANGVVLEPFSLLDLAPTLLDLASAVPEPRFEGHSWAALVRSDLKARLRRWVSPVERFDVNLQLLEAGSTVNPRVHEYGLVHGTDKLLLDPNARASLYNIADDPGERAPIADESRIQKLVSAVQAQNAELARRSVEKSEKVAIDAATLERLRALGYQQ